MKWLAIITTAVALSACANHQQDAQYWQARQAAIGALPPEQRAAADIELLRDEHAQVELERQRIADIINSSF